MEKIAVIGNIASLGYLIGKELRSRGFDVDNYYAYNKFTTMPDDGHVINLGKAHNMPFERTIKKVWFRTVKTYDIEIRLSVEKSVKSKHSVIIYNGSELRDGFMKAEQKCFITTKDLYAYVADRDAVFLPRCIDIDRFSLMSKKTWRDGEPLDVGHFPTDMQMKGTQLVQKAVTSLRSRGYDCNLVSGSVQHEEMPEYLSRIHVLCDWFTIGIYGVVSIEALAVGTPVVCYVKDEFFDYPEMKKLIVNCEPTADSVAEAILHATNKNVDSHKVVELYSPKHTVDVLLEALNEWQMV